MAFPSQRQSRCTDGVSYKATSVLPRASFAWSKAPSLSSAFAIRSSMEGRQSRSCCRRLVSFPVVRSSLSKQVEAGLAPVHFSVPWTVVRARRSSASELWTSRLSWCKSDNPFAASMNSSALLACASLAVRPICLAHCERSSTPSPRRDSQNATLSLRSVVGSIHSSGAEIRPWIPISTRHLPLLSPPRRRCSCVR
eukprot:scaffold2478_cov270-Pinguiococcus_pyrenoidosus.AAC.3